MIRRILQATAFASEWGRQMRFVAGPRQSGKTTLAKTFLREQGDEAFYYNWDDRGLRTRYHQGADFLKEDLLAFGGKKKRWVCYDEIHKMPKWKNILKFHFDTHEKNVSFIITGSARLDFFRRSGDSLTGRYFLFHLFPFNLFELTRKSRETLNDRSSSRDFVEDRIAHSARQDQTTMETLLAFGGFPEPFLKASGPFQRIWHRDYLDRLVREDLRDLTRLGELENVAALVSLLPERIGSPLSVNSLREDLAVSHKTLQNYLQALKLCYFIFEVPAYHKKIARTLKKEKKIYFHDWSFIPEEGPRFENYVAAELLSWLSLWHDSGRANFDLRYLRTREGKECDFLILRNAAPWLLVEAKLQAQPTPSYLMNFAKALGGIPMVQVVREEGVLRVGRQGEYCVSASRFFSA